MARAGSFVAERILGTSGSSPLLLILIARTPHTVQRRPTEDKRVAAKARKTFRARKTVSSSSGGDLIRVVTGPALTAACAVRLIAPLSLFHIGLIGPVSRLFWINPDRAFQDPNRRSENTGLH